MSDCSKCVNYEGETYSSVNCTLCTNNPHLMDNFQEKEDEDGFDSVGAPHKFGPKGGKIK